MSYRAVQGAARGGGEGGSGAAKSRRRASPRRGFAPAVQALEERVVLSFAAPVLYNVGTQDSSGLNGFGPRSVTADFNGDGKLDIAVSNYADGTVSVLSGKGDGTFRPAVTYGTGSGATTPDWMAVADFNGDGKIDLAVESNNGEISILMNNGGGGFAGAKVYAVGTGDRGDLAVGDFFGNGRQDIALAAFGANIIQILPNNGDGTFGTPISLTMPAGFTNIRSVVAGNFFGNGRADLAVAGGEGYNNVLSTTNPAGIALFENDGKGDFTFKASYNAAVTPDPGGGDGTGDTINPEAVNAADLNGDGKPDLVLSLYDHNIDVFLNNGDGTFQPAVAYTTETPGSVGGYPRGAVFGDFNGDGKMDIATLNFGEPVPADQPTPEPGSIGLLYGNGDGTFQAPVQYTPFLLPGGVAVGDFNGDGLPDLAVSQNYTGHSVGVMLNQPSTASEPPTVTALSPSAGPTTGGTVVTITGTNFTGASQVDFGTLAALSFTVNSDASITAKAPAGSAGAVDVTVYNAGASATGAADLFTYQSVGQAPVVTGVSPSIGSTAGGTVVTITGSNFTNATAVKFGGVAAVSFTVNSATSITARSPAEAAGVVDVVVTTPAGASAAASADRFTFQTPKLTTISVTPATATVLDGLTQLFVATAIDQFGASLAAQPSFTWSLAGLGSLSAVGLYRAPASGTGGATVSATSGGVVGTAKVTVAGASETWTGLGTTNNWSDAANWSANVVPGAGTTVVFSSASVKSAAVDPAFAGAVGPVQIYAGYTGTITLGRALTAASFAEGGGTYNANGFTTTVTGATTVSAGTYVASTNTQTFTGGLTVSGGLFKGSTGAVTVGNLTLSSGTLNAPTTTLTVTGGNVTVTGGAFNHDDGTVVYTGASVSPTMTLGAGLIAFYNFTDAMSTATGGAVNFLTINGKLTVVGTFAWKNGVNGIFGNIEAMGDVDDENHGGIGNPYLTLDGAANQSIEDLSGVGGGQFRTVTINKTAGVVSLTCNPIVFSNLTLTAGVVNTGADSWFVTGPISATTGLNLGNVEVDGANVTVVGANLQVANLTFAAAGDKLTAPTGNLSVSGNWADGVAALLVPDGGTVVFDGGAGTTQYVNSGGQPFYSLTIAAGATLVLQSDVTVLGVFTDYGILNANGHKFLR